MLERFSPYFDRPELGFLRRVPAFIYTYVYDVPEEELADMVYLFDTDSAGLTDEQAAQLHEAIAVWQQHCATSSLERLDNSSAIVLRDNRYGFDHGDHVIVDSGEVAAYLAMEQGRTAAGLERALREQGIEWSSKQVDDFLRGLAEYGLIFSDGDRSVAVATVDGCCGRDA